MKKFLFLASAAILLTACQESLEDRAAREASEFTRKNCPVRISDVITIDILVFDKSTLTLRYCMTANGVADTTALSKTTLRQDMVKALKGNPQIRPYKEAGYKFRYSFFSAKHKGQILYDITISKKDYKE